MNIYKSLIRKFTIYCQYNLRFASSICNVKKNTFLSESGNLAVKHMKYFQHTVYPKKYAHDFVVLCFVVVMQSFIMNPHEVFIHIHQGCFAGTGAIVRLPQCQWSKPDGYGKISQCITTTKHSKAKTVCIFLGIYCRLTVLIVFGIHFPMKFSRYWNYIHYKKERYSRSIPKLRMKNERNLG